jgi:hypothetical protein
MLEGTEVLATNRQIHDEALQLMMQENTILLVVPKASFEINFDLGTLEPFIKATSTETRILSTARNLELSPTSWDQLDGLIAILDARADEPFKSLTLNFARLLYDVSYEVWPKLAMTRARFKRLQRVGRVAEEVRIVWVKNPVDAFEDSRVYYSGLHEAVNREEAGQMQELIERTERILKGERAGLSVESWKGSDDGSRSSTGWRSWPAL